MTLAQYLKNKREELGYTLDEISSKNKINKEFLLGIETSNYSIFPAEVFRKGFLKVYARILDLDENYVLALDRREYTPEQKQEKLAVSKLKSENIDNTQKFSTNVSSNSQKQTIDLKQRFSKQSTLFTKDKLIKIFAILLLFLAAIFIKYQIDKANQLPELTLRLPANVSIRTIGKDSYKQSLTTTNPTITLAGNIDPNDQLYIQGALSRWNSFGQFQFDNYQLKLGENIIKLQAKNKLGRTSEIELDINYTESVSPTFTNSSSSSTSSSTNSTK